MTVCRFTKNTTIHNTLYMQFDLKQVTLSPPQPLGVGGRCLRLSRRVAMKRAAILLVRLQPARPRNMTTSERTNCAVHAHTKHDDERSGYLFIRHNNEHFNIVSLYTFSTDLKSSGELHWFCAGRDRLLNPPSSLTESSSRGLSLPGRRTSIERSEYKSVLESRG